MARKKSDLEHDEPFDFDAMLEGMSDEDVATARQATREAAILLGRQTILELARMVRDPSFSAQSRVAAGNGILRAGGFFDRSTDEGSGKEPGEMTPAELQREITKFRAKAKKSVLDSGDDIFA